MTSRRPPATPNICPTSVHPPESTLQTRRSARSKPDPAFPFVKPTGVFRLLADENRVPPQPPATDPIDPRRELNPIIERAARDPNRFLGVEFRHATWAANRDHVLDALAGGHYHLQYTGEPETDEDRRQLHEPIRWGKRLARFESCGTLSTVLQSADDPAVYKVACNRCHDRFCLPCAQDRARLIVANLREQLPYETTRFLTLTLKHSNESLKAQLSRLYDSFVKLRRFRFWIDLVTGGIAFLELKLSSHDDCWHPHLHILLRGKYVPQKLISDAWLQVTGDSHIVDIRPVKSADHLYTYLTKYVTKGWSSGIYRNSHRLCEALDALHGRKLLLSFGCFAHVKLLLPPSVTTWLTLGTLHEIIVLHKRGTSWASAAYVALFAEDYEPPLCVIPPDG